MTSRGLPFFLALRDLRSDWRASLCFVAAVVGILAPLLIILALKNGVIGTMVGGLIEDPTNRELIAVGAGNHDAAFFATLAARSDVAFVIPRTRSINTSADIVRNRATRKVERSVPLIPTAQGDPLLESDAAIGRGQAYITTGLADQLNLVAGDPVEVMIQRSVDSRIETAETVLTVTGIVPPDRFSRPAIFIALEDLLAVERFRDDQTTSAQAWRDDVPPPASYASFRLYVTALEDLDRVRDVLTAQGVEARARAENAILLLGFRNNLNILYTAVATIACIGFWAAMAANLRGMVERQRISFSFFNLIGMTRSARRLIPVIQSVTLVLGGIAATLILVLPTVFLINTYFTTPGGSIIAHLGLFDLCATVLLGLLTSLTASLWAVRAVQNISPDEVLRHA